MEKTKIAVIFGGRSGEHEVSLVSAQYVIAAMNSEKYDVTEIGITLEGKWLTGENCLQKFKERKFEGLSEIHFDTDTTKCPFEIAFPVLHGPYGEDGTIQGLFEMLQIPYVGCGVLASALSMDKLQTKAAWEAAGLPVVPYIGFTRKEWQENSEKILSDILKKLGLPCFVKPANMGSSVGISKAKTEEDIVEAINLAAKFDRRILVEKAVNAREIECAVLGNDDPVAGQIGEILVGGEFYDYNDKYVNGVSTTQIPADIPADKMEIIRENSIKAYKILDCAGLARVDSFLDRENGEIFLNEINTMPGFTTISMYPKMMMATGMTYEGLIDKLIALGIERFQEKKKNQIAFDSESDWFKK